MARGAAHMAVLLEDPLPARFTGHWRRRLERLAQTQWAGYRRHPWLPGLVSMTRPQLSLSGMRHTEYVLETLSELPFGDETLLREAVSVLAYVRGMAVSLEAERHAEQDAGMNNDEWMRSREHAFAAVMTRFPVLQRVSRLPDVDMTLDALFACGLSNMLEGLAARAETTGAGRADLPPRTAHPQRVEMYVLSSVHEHGIASLKRANVVFSHCAVASLTAPLVQ